MRTHKIGDTTIEYPEEISFCFNPMVLNIFGHAWAFVEVVITDVKSNAVNSEKRVMFGSSCFFDVSFYTQSYFDSVQFGKIDYKQLIAQETQLGRLFSIEVNFYSNDTTMVDSFQFNTFVVWGAMKTGERYNGDRELIWFKNFPFTVGFYTAGINHVDITSDGEALPSVNLASRNIYDIPLVGVNAQRELILVMPGGSDGASVFDMTFDYTFRAVIGASSKVKLSVNDCRDGIYLRWINRHGFYCYWLFTPGDESRQVSNDGEFLRNNMQDYSYMNGYHGGSGRKQRKMEEGTIPVCAPLVDSTTYDFLFHLSTTPVVDMYAGKDDDGVDQWIGVNIAVGSYNKTRAVLQDFVATIILPETRLQSL